MRIKPGVRHVDWMRKRKEREREGEREQKSHTKPLHFTTSRRRQIKIILAKFEVFVDLTEAFTPNTYSFSIEWFVRYVGNTLCTLPCWFVVNVTPGYWKIVSFSPVMKMLNESMQSACAMVNTDIQRLSCKTHQSSHCEHWQLVGASINEQNDSSIISWSNPRPRTVHSLASIESGHWLTRFDRL